MLGKILKYDLYYSLTLINRKKKTRKGKNMVLKWVGFCQPLLVRKNKQIKKSF
jgi:hypothetical protein